MDNQINHELMSQSTRHSRQQIPIKTKLSNRVGKQFFFLIHVFRIPMAIVIKILLADFARKTYCYINVNMGSCSTRQHTLKIILHNFAQ